jgi:hypothetical protein
MARSEVRNSIRWWVAAPVIGLAAVFAPLPPLYVEQFYSRDLYPLLQRTLTTLSNLAPFAILDVLIAAALLLVLYRTVRLLMVAFARGPFDAAWEGIRRVLRAVGVTLMAFALLWGFNYRRVPLEETLPKTELVPESVESLQALIVEANNLAARIRPQVDEDISFAEASEVLEDPMNVALEELSRRPLAPRGHPKSSVLLSPFFTLAGVNGVLNPFALESIVHPDLVPVERPFVLAHEWAHLAGHGDEAEANAVGWLACMKGPPTLAYSASLFLIMEAAGRLPGPARTRALDRLDARIRADISLISRRMLLQNPHVQRAATRVYDEYLHANGVKEGVASYGLALRLLLSPPFRDALRTYGQ